MPLLGNPESHRKNLQGEELKSLGLAYEVSNLVGGERGQTLWTETRRYSDSKRRHGPCCNVGLFCHIINQMLSTNTSQL